MITQFQRQPLELHKLVYHTQCTEAQLLLLQDQSHRASENGCRPHEHIPNTKHLQSRVLNKKNFELFILETILAANLLISGHTMQKNLPKGSLV